MTSSKHHRTHHEPLTTRARAGCAALVAKWLWEPNIGSAASTSPRVHILRDRFLSHPRVVGGPPSAVFALVDPRRIFLTGAGLPPVTECSTGEFQSSGVRVVWCVFVGAIPTAQLDTLAIGESRSWAPHPHMLHNDLFPSANTTPGLCERPLTGSLFTVPIQLPEHPRSVVRHNHSISIRRLYARECAHTTCDQSHCCVKHPRMISTQRCC